MLSKEKILEIMEDMDLWICTVNYEGGYKVGDKEVIIFQDNEQIEDFIRECKANNLDEILQLLGCEMVYNEDVFYCEYCGSYHYYADFTYINNYVNLENEIVCLLDFRDNIEDYIDEFVNNYNKALHEPIDILETELGYTRLNDIFDCGLNGGTEPKEVYEKLNKEYDNIVFFINSADMFTTEYGVYVKNDEE